MALYILLAFFHPDEALYRCCVLHHTIILLCLCCVGKTSFFSGILLVDLNSEYKM